mmetsp:Transcript_11533/g.32713  ORF Transcript_11533/g.32713 Transcript_11533/m.32713 type:complete len:193 (-) Transcript_11533:334-912(-)
MAPYEWSAVGANRDLIVFRPADPEDLPAIVEMEQTAFPPDEADSPEKMKYRMKHAPHLCMVAEKVATGGLIGMISATATTKKRIDKEVMGTHEAAGRTVCIHSVVVVKEEQRKGVATGMLKSFIQWLQRQGPLDRFKKIQLLCKEAKLSLYEKLDFRVMGVSPISLGKDQWLEMEFNMDQVLPVVRQAVLTA